MEQDFSPERLCACVCVCVCVRERRERLGHLDQRQRAAALRKDGCSSREKTRLTAF